MEYALKIITTTDISSLAHDAGVSIDELLKEEALHINSISHSSSHGNH